MKWILFGLLAFIVIVDIACAKIAGQCGRYEEEMWEKEKHDGT